MKRVLKISACALLAVAIAFLALCVYAATYSSEDDPIVSLSYVNKVLLPQIKEMITDASLGKDISNTETFPSGTVNTGTRYDTVNLKEGEVLYASVYSCEVIVRSGNTKVVSPYTVKWEEQGIFDITDGIDLFNDEAVPNNHNIIIPRDDGRGIVTLEGGAWFMIRGDYIIKNANGEVVVK